MYKIHVLVVTEHEKSRLVYELTQRLNNCTVTWVAPEKIDQQINGDHAIFTTCDYHIVTDHIPSVPLLKKHMNEKISRWGILKHLLIAVTDSDDQLHIACQANVTYPRSIGVNPIVDKILSVRKSNFDGRANNRLGRRTFTS